MTTFPYSEKVLEHFKNPHNVGKMEDANAKATEGSPACGDMMKMWIRIDEKEEVIRELKWQTFGCASAIDS